MCRHSTCSIIWNELNKCGYTGDKPGVFAYQGCDKFVLMVLERFGVREDTYNLPGGEMDPDDELCFIATMIRELNEEVLLNLTGTSKWEEFDEIFKGPNGTFKFAIHASGGYGSVVFIGNPVADEDKFDELVVLINAKIKKNIVDPTVSRCYKEIECVEVMPVNMMQYFKLSDFAKALVYKSLYKINKP